jgi:5-methylcytosine-specific restriction endonuclease McrA
MPGFRKSAKWKRARAAEIARRDGPDCWLCTRPIPKVPKRPGQRASIEHLVARVHGGGNELENLVLCHDACNRHLGDRPIDRKLKMRAKWHQSAARQAAPGARRRQL